MDQELFRSVLRLLCGLIPAEEATLWVPTEDGLSLEAILNHGPQPEQVVGFSVPVASSQVGWVWASGQGLCLGPEGPFHPGLATLTKVPTRTMMASVVNLGGERRGVISVINPRDKPLFGREDLTLLDRWCDRLGPMPPERPSPGSCEEGDWLDDVRAAASLAGLWSGPLASDPGTGILEWGHGHRFYFRPEGPEARNRLLPFLPILEVGAEVPPASSSETGADGPSRAVAAVEALVARGEYLKAADLAAESGREQPLTRLRQLQALALARGRSVDAASTVLDALVREVGPDAESLGLLARLAKDRWEMDGGDPGSPLLAAAIDAYEAAFEHAPGHWPAINAATLARVAGRSDQADRWIAAALEGANRELQVRSDDAWARSTLGEVCLHLGDDQAASLHFEAAFPSQGSPPLGSRASARRNGRMLMKALGRPEADLDRILAPPRIAVFSGHRVDPEGHPQERFPARLVPEVRAALLSWVEARKPDHVLAGAASGSDLLLLEILAGRGIPFTVVLPCEVAGFIPFSVAAGWEERFSDALLKAEGVHVLNEGGIPEEGGGLRFATDILLGHSLWKARDLGGELEALAVWDPGSTGGPGGTGEFLSRASAARMSCSILDLRQLRETGKAEIQPHQASPAAPAQALPTGLQRQVRPFLFGDLAGFSSLKDSQVEAFVTQGLGLVGALRDRHGDSVTEASTWGDGLFLAFETMHAAASFTTDLLEAWGGRDWREHGLPENLAWRLSLHAGPLALSMDPVAHRPSVFGKPLVRAARMEPVTPPGAIYTSLEFVALAMLEGMTGIAFDYAGRVPLAKNSGTYPVFRMRKARKDRT